MDVRSADAADFVARFAEFWTHPDPDDLTRLLTDDVHLVQPLSPPTRGIDAAHAAFRRLFAQFPDLHARVDRWRGDDTYVFIEFHLIVTLGKTVVEWPAIDRFTLREGKASERVSYFDPLPLLGRLLRRPRAAWRALRG